jgi:hypothetical protein
VDRAIVLRQQIKGKEMNMESHKSRVTEKFGAWVLLSAALLLCSRSEAQPTTFSSGSTGADGALNITAPGVTYFNPTAMNLTKNTNIFNFTTITIAAGSILKFWEGQFHGPVFLLASGAVTINGVIDITGDASPGPTATAAQQGVEFAGSGGYTGGMGGIHGDSNHAALPGNGPGGGATGIIGAPFAVGGKFSGDQLLVPLVGGSGGGGTNDDNGDFGAQGGAGGGSILIASSTTITLNGNSGYANAAETLINGVIYAYGGYGSSRGCGGSGGAVRLVANTIAGGPNNNGIQVQGGGSGAFSTQPGSGLYRIEAGTTSFSGNVSTGPGLFSVPYALNLPTVALPTISVTSIGGIAINANPFSFPDATINSSSAVPVIITATNVPLTSTVTMYLLSDSGPDQTIPVTLTGTNLASTATVNVTFPTIGTRGFVKAVFH